MRDSFIFYTEYSEVLDALTAEQAGLLIRAMVSYTKGEPVNIADSVVKAVFITIKPRMDRDREKWEAEVEKRREAGRKGGKARAENAKQSQAKPSKAKQSKANQADTDTDSVYDTDNNTNCAFTRSQVDGIFERLWKMYPEKKGKARVSYADKRKLADIGEEKIADAIERYKKEVSAIGWKHFQNGSTFFHSGYVDYLEENYVPTAEKTKRPPERDYDMDDLELKLLATN